MDVIDHISKQSVLFFVLYGITAAVPFMSALYLLLRRANAFAPDVTPSVRLRRWAASFFIVSALGHLWWLLFYFFSNDIFSHAYFVVVTVDFVGMVITIAGTMLSMLQDRRRPIWPAFVAMIPFLVLVLLQTNNPDVSYQGICIIYNLALYVLFFIYMVFAIRRYERWLNDNYADLENKKVWLSQAVSLAYVLVFILYVLVDTNSDLLISLHIAELLFFVLLLWRVETLPSLTPDASQEEVEADSSSAEDTGSKVNPVPFYERPSGQEALAQVELLLDECCVATQLYLQHDLNVRQLSKALGTNRTYLSQYFTSRGVTYNSYINDLRINHFMSRCQEIVAAGKPVVAVQLARESGYSSYSTFSRAFKERTGQSATAWMQEIGGAEIDESLPES